MCMPPDPPRGPPAFGGQRSAARALSGSAPVVGPDKFGTAVFRFTLYAFLEPASKNKNIQLERNLARGGEGGLRPANPQRTVAPKVAPLKSRHEKEVFSK